MNTLSVHLDNPATGALSYRAWFKGARWRSGFKNIDAVCADADKQTGEEAYAINYVSRKAP